jgi:hypothetical protein
VHQNVDLARHSPLLADSFLSLVHCVCQRLYIFAKYDKISGFRGGESLALGEVMHSCKWILMCPKSMPPLSSWLSMIKP